MLADPGFILPPEFDRPITRLGRDDAGDKGGKVFLCASWASPFALGWRGRTEIWLKFIAF